MLSQRSADGVQWRKESLPDRQAPDLTMRGSCYANTAKRFSPIVIVPTPRSCRLLTRYPCRRRSRRIRNRHNQRLSRKASSWSSGRYRPGLTPRGGVRESACSFNFMSACRYIWVVSTDSCPSQRAITERSTPCWRRSMAAECRSACGLTFFRLRDRHFSAAMEMYFSSRRSMASRLSFPPRILAKSGSSGRPWRSRIQASSIFAVSGRRGVHRCFLPFPWQ